MNKINDQSLTKPVIIFFDGVCNLCNGFVDFLIVRDSKAKIKFASLQGETAKQALPALYVDELQTVVLKEGENIYIKSTAAIFALSKLGGPWRLVRLLLIIPVPIRDFFYNVIAANRYKLFGKKELCRVPTEAEKLRFLD